jgi:hypothetical protein
MLPTLMDMNAINAASFSPSTCSNSVVFLGRNAAKCFVSIIGASRLSFRVASAASCEILSPGELRDERPGYEQAEAQVCGFGLGAVIVAVFAVGVCVGDRGLGVEVDFLDVKAKGVGSGKAEAVEDAGPDAGWVRAGSCYNREGGGCGGEEVSGQSEANAAGHQCCEGQGHGWKVDWLSAAIEDGS